MNVLIAASTVIAVMAGLLLREVVTVLRAGAPAEESQTLVGEAAQSCAATIPKVIWAYWDTSPPPPFVQACLSTWHRYAPDHEVRLLDRTTVTRWLDSLRTDFDTLPAYRQADWLRIHLLARHGGIWMDASTLLTRDLDWLHLARSQSQAEYVGFFINRYSTRLELPLIENWFMASVAGGHFATELAAAFDLALDEGAEQVLQRLQYEGRRSRVVQALTEDLQRYLLMHVVAADLLDRRQNTGRLVLLRAEDGPFAWLSKVGWRKRHLYARLALTPCPRSLPALIKLRGGDRTVAERNWLRGRMLKSSALARLIGPAP
ncbi:MAG TPA: capsular polysaccharide synthesis protein [Roseateles sp.]|nr:capsular polysaccharide synthesis protein [Roseateles sp.]